MNNIAMTRMIVLHHVTLILVSSQCHELCLLVNRRNTCLGVNLYTKRSQLTVIGGLLYS